MDPAITAGIITAAAAIIAAVIAVRYNSKRSNILEHTFESYSDWENQEVSDREERSQTNIESISEKDLLSKISGFREKPNTLLAVKRQGEPLADYLGKELEPSPTIIPIEKNVSKKQIDGYARIPIKGGFNEANYFIESAKWTNELIGDVFIIDDVIDSGRTVLSIIDRLQPSSGNRYSIKAVATISVNKAYLDKIESALRIRGVELLYLRPYGVDFYEIGAGSA